MKKFLKAVFHSKLVRNIRNLTGIRPELFLFAHEDQYLLSDLFIWRTDSNFETVFNASDILNKYYDIPSKLYFIFFDSDGGFILTTELEFKNGVSRLIINEQLIGTNSYGTFCVLNIPTESYTKQINVTNRCYVGYGRDNAFSMVHGNMFALMVTKPSATLDDLITLLRPAISSRKSNFCYHIQKKQPRGTNTSYWFSNPLARSIKINIGNKTITIQPRGCGFISFDKNEASSKPHIIKSDFSFARPILINEKDGFLDCHHG